MTDLVMQKFLGLVRTSFAAGLEWKKKPKTKAKPKQDFGPSSLMAGKLLSDSRGRRLKSEFYTHATKGNGQTPVDINAHEDMDDQ